MGRLCRDLSKYILAIIRRLGAADADIDDLMQQVLIEIWKAVVKYERRKNTRFRNWLSTVTPHTVYRFYRKQNKRINADELINQADMINAEIEGLIEEEWNEFIAAKAMESLNGKFSAMKIQLFIDCARGIKDDQLASKNDIALSSVRVYRAQVHKALQREAKRLNRELD